MKMFYDKPAKHWLEALPLGNGRLGAMVYGGIQKEIIQINEMTLWSGWKEDADNPDCLEHLDEMRSLIFSGKYQMAEELCKKYMICKGVGTNSGFRGCTNNNDVPYGSYQTAGNVILDFGNIQARNYRRELDIFTGVAKITFDGHERTIFCSFKNNVTVINVKGHFPQITFEREMVDIKNDDNIITVTGIMNDGKGISFATVVKCVNNTIYITTATTYKNNNNPLDACNKTIEKAIAKGYDLLLSENIEYVKSVMDRAEISIEGEKYNTTSTDKRIEMVKAGNDDMGLIEIYFQFGRYLLMCSSRDSLPANLQGIWAEEIYPMWSADYHTNINIQMNYWLTDVVNLSDCYKPFFDYLKMLAENGTSTAKIQYGCDGWVAHTVTNPWGFTSPGEYPSWGSFVCGGAWCTNHIWQHYLFTCDKKFLRENYPIIKGSVQFFMDFLVKDPNTGYLVTAPSNSPELGFFDSKTGENAFMCAGPTMDNSILYEVFTNAKNCSDVLGIDAEFAQKAIHTREQLPPIKLGSDGRIMEWQYELEEIEKGHRHMSPLYGLYPASLITKEKTPELIDGAKKFIQKRLKYSEELEGWNTRSVGWSCGWLTNFFARLEDGEEAYTTIISLLANCTEPNLFDSHPLGNERLFQIDGNLGGTAGIAEMLIQSHEEYIKIIPAIPKKWSSGSFRGLKARGGFEVCAEWKNGKVTSCRVKSTVGNILKIKINEEKYLFNTKKDQIINIVLNKL